MYPIKRFTYRGNQFFAANQAVVTTTVGLALTYTGLVLSNPITSNVKLVLKRCSYMQSVIQATQVEGVALAVGFNGTVNVTHTTPATPQSNIVGTTPTPVGKVDSAATLPTAPTYLTFVGNTANATSNGPAGYFDFDETLELIPGAYLLWVTPTQASVAGMWFSFQWNEVPVTF